MQTPPIAPMVEQRQIELCIHTTDKTGEFIEIQHVPVSPELDLLIHHELGNHEMERMGRRGIEPSIAYQVTNTKGQVIGAVVFRLFWGALHIKYLYVDKAYRTHRIGTILMEQTFRFAQHHNCSYAYIETTSYQALNFYQKLGFEIEHTRNGFSDGVAFHYLRKSITERKEP